MREEKGLEAGAILSHAPILVASGGLGLPSALIALGRGGVAGVPGPVKVLGGAWPSQLQAVPWSGRKDGRPPDTVGHARRTGPQRQ